MSQDHIDLPHQAFDYPEFARRYAGQAKIEETIKGALERHIGVRSRSLTGPFHADPGVEAKQLLDAAAEGLKRLADDPATSLTTLQQAGVEAVVELEERPALLVLRDDVESPPERWTDLHATYRKDIRGRLPVAGGITTRSNHGHSVGATGFVVAPGVVMTNRHVLEHLDLATEDLDEAPAKGAEPDAPWKLWHLNENVKAAIDFKAEHGNPEVKRFRILEVLGAPYEKNHPYLDVAFLRVAEESEKVDGISPGGEPLPAPFRISMRAPAPADREVYAIGYPVADNEAADPDPAIASQIQAAMKQIFGGIYSVKRLQPGEMRSPLAPQRVFPHDCSTLGGNSGSVVVSLTTNKVIGIHFKGKRRTANWAVALWMLKDDPYLKYIIKLTFA